MPAHYDQQDRDGYTVLMLAAMLCLEGAVKALVAGGASLDVQDAHGCTALMRAVECCDDASVKALVAGSASLDLQNSHGSTALMLAAERRDSATVKTLVAGGASLDLQGVDGRTALMWAAAEEGNQVTVETLVVGGASLDTLAHLGCWDSDECTALMLSTTCNHVILDFARKFEPVQRTRAFRALRAGHRARLVKRVLGQLLSPDMIQEVIKALPACWWLQRPL